MLSLFGIGWNPFGLMLDYVLAIILCGGGLYLAFTYAEIKFLRFVGILLIALGVFTGAVAYGRTQGAKDCIAASKVARLREELAAKQRDLDAMTAAAKEKSDAAATLAAQKENADEQVADWTNYANKLAKDVAACRRATRDDNKRLCNILGNAPAGCPHP